MRSEDTYTISGERIKAGLSTLLIILLAAFTGLAVARFVLTFSTYFVVLAVMGVVIALLLAKNLQFGMVAYFFIAALAFGESPGVQSPNSGYNAGLMPSQIMLAFLAMLWFVKTVLTERFRLVKTSLNLPLAVFGSLSLASLLIANVLRGSKELRFHQMLITQVAEVGLLFFSICAFFAVANVLKEARWIRRVFLPVTLFGVYYAAEKIFHVRMPVPVMWGALLLSAAIAFAYSRLLFERMDRWKTLGMIALLGAFLYVAYHNLAWVSGWVATSVAIFVISLYRSRALAVALVLLGIFGMFVYPGVYRDVHHHSETGGDFDRFTIWRDAFSMFMSVNPMLGVGPGNYNPYVRQYSTIWWAGNRNTYTTAHSNYVQIASETGLLGLAAFLWVIVSAIHTGHRSARASPQDLRWLGIAATAIISGMAVASLFGDYIFPSRGNNGIVNFGTTVYPWLILGAAAAAGHLRPEPTSTVELVD